ncbi:MAG: hypothetical protein AUK28_07250 [Desulfobacterales bacterium CG2_30_60_27]|nr:MAG: hypothetical protein AUK28_07250 [Desulfobacterales bacterium CG2_30_60_27]
MVGIFLLVAGLTVTALFWVPTLVNRPRLKELLGSRYPLLYVVYAANGPALALLGLVLLIIFG